MLTIADLSLQRGGVWLLESANLTVQPGQRVALVGANGAGKSSLFQLILGQLSPEQGPGSEMTPSATRGRNSSAETKPGQPISS